MKEYGGLINDQTSKPIASTEIDDIVMDGGGDNYYFNVHVSHVCQDPKCEAAFCYECMKDYVRYSATVQLTNEEAYRIWYNKNKYRRLNFAKPVEYEEWVAPAYCGDGKSHHQWLQDKREEERKRLQKMIDDAAKAEAEAKAREEAMVKAIEAAQKAAGKAGVEGVAAAVAAAAADISEDESGKKLRYNLKFEEWAKRKHDERLTKLQQHSAELKKVQEIEKEREQTVKQFVSEWHVKKKKWEEDQAEREAEMEQKRVEELKKKMRKLNKPIYDVKDPNREPELPEYWVWDYDDKMKKLRTEQQRENIRK